jgi:hypothetical protein
MLSVIKLFTALPIAKKGNGTISDTVLRKTIEKGFIFSRDVAYNYSERELLDFADDIGLSPEEMNSSFHKSWMKIRESDLMLLVCEQIIHYLTTYGYERLGIYDENTIFIPTEELQIPHIDVKQLPLKIIKGYTNVELKKKLFELLQTGIALNENTINDVLDVARYVGFDEEDILSIKNKEVKISLYDNLNLIPQDPIEFLRYAIFKCTGMTLLIKNWSTISAIKEGADISHLFLRYKQQYGLSRLAEIFHRFKPLFLAFKSYSNLKSTINKIRKLADEYHKPMPKNYLNDITFMIKHGEPIYPHKFQEELDKVNIFRKIRLAYALNYKNQEVTSILYRVRNGKSYAKEYNSNDIRVRGAFGLILETVLNSIIGDMHVKGKKIYIPNHIVYALPATEKQFTGNFPSGSYIKIPHDMVVGIHWKDVNHHRIDLDLSLVNVDAGKFGWDSTYRNKDRTILFSGDMTAAPKGASELFYIKKQQNANFIMFVNFYNYGVDIEVPFKIMVAKETVTNFEMNYIINPNNMMAIADSTINQKQKILGLLSITQEDSRFYFAESYLGNTITSGTQNYVMHARNYLFDFYKHTITLNEILEMAGAILVDEKEKCDIDLSPETLKKDSIIKLIKYHEK